MSEIRLLLGKYRQNNLSLSEVERLLQLIPTTVGRYCPLCGGKVLRG